MISLSTNLKAKAATTQFTKFDYNSMVKMGNKYLCASDQGLFELKGDTDNSENILSYFEPITMDFGISQEKRLRAVYFGYEANGDIFLTVSTDLGLSEVYTVPATTNGQQARKIIISRSIHGRYWTFHFQSTGCFFAIDHISILPIVRGHGFDTN